VRRDETGIVMAEWLLDHPSPDGRRIHVTILAMQRGEREDQPEKGYIAASLPPDVDPVEAFELRQCLPPEARRADGPRQARSVQGLLRLARQVGRDHPAYEVVVI